MLLQLAILFGSVLIVQSSPITNAVTDYQCGRSFTIDETETFVYNGGYLSYPCKLKFSPSDSLDDICVSAITYDTTCQVTLEYHDGFIGVSPDEEADCYSTNPTEEHCTLQNNLYVVFDKKDAYPSNERIHIEFKVYRKDNNIVKDVQTAVYITVGVILGIIVLVIIASVVVIIICCNRRHRSAAGMVYNQTQMQNTTVAQVPYPYPAQPVPQQQYYPPGPQPIGYGHTPGPQPVTGYPHAPGAYGTGYQGPPAYSEPEKMASAPAMSGDDFQTQPPPYPGN